MTKIYNNFFIDLLPESIKNDFTIKTIASALDEPLKQNVLSISNILIYNRLLETAGYSQSMLPALERITTEKGGIKALSNNELELLAWQFHVDFREIARTDVELAKMIIESINWHKIKGTPASIKNSLEIFDISADLEEFTSSNWAMYQMSIEAETTEEVILAYTIAKSMQPARCQLNRIYSGDNDGRIIIHDTQSTWGTYYWDLESGVLVEMPDGSNIVVSLGKNTKVRVESPDIKVFYGKNSNHIVKASLDDHFIWGFSKWGDFFPQQARFYASSYGYIVITEKLNDNSCFVKKEVDFFEQIVWDDNPNKEGSAWGDINFNWGLGGEYLSYNSQVWGDFIWGEDLQAKSIYTKKRFLQNKALFAEMEIKEEHACTVSHAHAKGSNILEPPHTWTRAWDERTWQSLGFPIHKNEEF